MWNPAAEAVVVLRCCYYYYHWRKEVSLCGPQKLGPCRFSVFSWLGGTHICPPLNGEEGYSFTFLNHRMKHTIQLTLWYCCRFQVSRNLNPRKETKTRELERLVLQTEVVKQGILRVCIDRLHLAVTCAHLMENQIQWVSPPPPPPEGLWR